MKFSLSCLVLASSLCAATYAHAATITSARVYTSVPDGLNASDPSNINGNYADFTIGATGINYSAQSSAPLSTFLNGPTFSNQHGSFLASGPSLNIEIVITGSIFLTANEVLALTHDDGADLFLDGVEEITSPNQTVAITNTYNGETAGLHTFKLEYAANGTPPSVLEFTAGGTAVAPTPEPSSLILLGTGLATAAGFARRRFSRAV